MVKELVNILDKNGKITKLIQSKKYAHKTGLWHATVHIWVYNSNEELLLQKRSKDKRLWPKKLGVSVGGHISAEEDADKAAVREILEEIGLRTTIKKIHNIGVIKSSTEYDEKSKKEGYTRHCEFIHVYLLKYDGEISKLKPQHSEVDYLRFVPLNKIESELKDTTKRNRYAHSKTYYTEIIKIVRNKIKSEKKLKNISKEIN